MNKNYTTHTKVEDFLRATIDYNLDDLILGVQEYIEGYTGKSFSTLCDTATARLFNGSGTNELLINDCTEITKVELGDDYFANSFTEVLSTGTDRYLLSPNNYSEKGVPIDKIILTENIFGKGIQNHRITAKWGYSTNPPADIVIIATILVAGMYNAKNSVNGLNSETIGSYSVSFNNQEQLNAYKKALDILSRYKERIIC